MVVPVVVHGSVINEDWVHLLLAPGQSRLSVAHLAMLKLDLHNNTAPLEVAFLKGLDFEFQDADAGDIRVLSFARLSESIRAASNNATNAKKRTTKSKRKIGSQRRGVARTCD